jgi:ABC-type nitrate/sulfonate/bicarbonate transport system ATPase subunit
VLDEPLGALDVVLRRELSSIIKNLVTSKNLIGIVVTHQPEDALFLADEILLLAKSSIFVGSNITRKFKRGLDYNDSSFYPELISELERGKQ